VSESEVSEAYARGDRGIALASYKAKQTDESTLVEKNVLSCVFDNQLIASIIPERRGNVITMDCKRRQNLPWRHSH
jgi:hypothetical protein